MKRLTGSIVAIAGAAMLMTLAVIPAAGQAPGRALRRTADGKPDFSGIWEVMVFYRHTEPNFRLLDYECYAFALDDVPIVPTK